MSKMTEQELLRSESTSSIYEKLEKRNKVITANVDSYMDVVAKFSKEEARAFLRRKQLGNHPYDSHIIKYLRDFQRKNSKKRTFSVNHHYLIYATRFVASLPKTK